jgi:hydrogenase expression/formation protein HypD
MPKERIDHAYELAMQKDTIIVTLGDMIKVPGSNGSLQDARAKGGDIRFVYSPLDALSIAKENQDKEIIFFAIGFETTTPMTTALIDAVIKQDIKNITFHINHVTVPEVMREIAKDEKSKIEAFLGPSHVSVISGSKIYDEFPRDYNTPVVVSGFEPVDIMESILMLVRQFTQNRCELEIEYKRLVSHDGNIKAQKLIDKYLIKDDFFKWRGLGNVAKSSYRLRDEYSYLDAEIKYKDILPTDEINDHKLCICPEILCGRAKPSDCTIFGTACKPSSPVGSCMVSSEGACAAYYKYGNLI